jgi:hypothetical protein
LKCSDPECDKTATRELYGIPMCEDYYVEAIEHCGHILSGVPKPIKINLPRQSVYPQWTDEERQLHSKRIREILAGKKYEKSIAISTVRSQRREPVRILNNFAT